MRPLNYNASAYDQTSFSTLTGGIRADHLGRGWAFMPDAPSGSVAVDSGRVYTYGDFTLQVRSTIDHAPSTIVYDGLWEPGTGIFSTPPNPWTTQPQDAILVLSIPNGDHADAVLATITGGVLTMSAPLFQFCEGQYSDWTLSRSGNKAIVAWPTGSYSADCTLAPLRRGRAVLRPGPTLGFYVVYGEDLQVS